TRMMSSKIRRNRDRVMLRRPKPSLRNIFASHGFRKASRATSVHCRQGRRRAVGGTENCSCRDLRWLRNSPTPGTYKNIEEPAYSRLSQAEPLMNCLTAKPAAPLRQALVRQAIRFVTRALPPEGFDDGHCFGFV